MIGILCSCTGVLKNDSEKHPQPYDGRKHLSPDSPAPQPKPMLRGGSERDQLYSPVFSYYRVSFFHATGGTGRRAGLFCFSPGRLSFPDSPRPFPLCLQENSPNPCRKFFSLAEGAGSCIPLPLMEYRERLSFFSANHAFPLDKALMFHANRPIQLIKI